MVERSCSTAARPSRCRPAPARPRAILAPPPASRPSPTGGLRSALTRLPATDPRTAAAGKTPVAGRTTRRFGARRTPGRVRDYAAEANPRKVDSNGSTSFAPSGPACRDASGPGLPRVGLVLRAGCRARRGRVWKSFQLALLHLPGRLIPRLARLADASTRGSRSHDLELSP